MYYCIYSTKYNMCTFKEMSNATPYIVGIYLHIATY